ncbi:unnamed protein product [Cylicocyclus nassatus]|uniref:Galectin n=1 Tax=Cylicocyclus nassatus TaxID=53992 RepID=A0AA36HH09_CYLNA|nr:unnamed protein product [Cylicocyclus nassatus]
MHTYTAPDTPLVLPFYEELQSNSTIDIRAEVCSPEKKFFIEIISGPHSLLNVEFCFGLTKAIILRSCSSSMEGNDTVQVGNPLYGGQKFRLTVHVRDSYYEVLLNGKFIAEFPHRYPTRLAQCLAISKYVNIKIIDFVGLSNACESPITVRSVDEPTVEKIMRHWAVSSA